LSVAVTVTGSGLFLRGYRYFWIKTVKGFHPKLHCARCLVGEYLTSREQPFRLGVRYPLRLFGAPYGYICGVANKGGWEANFHLAFEPSPNREAVLVRPMLDGQILTLHGAKALQIPSLPPGWRGLPDEFTTCRNYRFGVAMFGPDGTDSTPAQLRL
jgi:hypothetical protein